MTSCHELLIIALIAGLESRHLALHDCQLPRNIEQTSLSFN